MDTLSASDADIASAFLIIDWKHAALPAQTLRAEKSFDLWTRSRGAESQSSARWLVWKHALLFGLGITVAPNSVGTDLHIQLQYEELLRDSSSHIAFS